MYTGSSKNKTVYLTVNKIMINNFSDRKMGELTEPLKQFLVKWYLHT